MPLYVTVTFGKTAKAVRSLLWIRNLIKKKSGGFVQNFTGMNHMVVMTAMYLFVFVIIMLFRNSLSENSDAPTNVAAPSALQMRCKTMAEEAHLTPREIEVFMLLAQGRDRSYIQSELYISEATVKTHSQHIYAKLGVHNKQELISLVQQRED